MQVPATGAVCAAIAQARRIHVGDVLALRHSLLAAGRASRQEAETLFALAGENLPACAQWREFFIEAIADCLSGGRMRDASLGEADAHWLIAMIESAPLDEGLEFALVSEVMGRTQCCPSILMRFVLGRLNDLSERATATEGPQPAFEAARLALQAAGLAGRLYVRRPAPDDAAAAA
ncbi:MAG: hypothetical protein K2Y29_10490 [Beijerinckiaceae bacterium]|nr:hypothetical protein [Beijerinckiaceae bacterium]